MMINRRVEDNFTSELLVEALYEVFTKIQRKKAFFKNSQEVFIKSSKKLSLKTLKKLSIKTFKKLSLEALKKLLLKALKKLYLKSSQEAFVKSSQEAFTSAFTKSHTLLRSQTHQISNWIFPQKHICVRHKTELSSFFHFLFYLFLFYSSLSYTLNRRKWHKCNIARRESYESFLSQREFE